MTYDAITPFRRRVDAVQIRCHATLMQPSSGGSVDKWAILRDLVAGRETFGVSDRDLTVLQALVSFHPRNDLGDPERLIVYPSNSTICDRLNGMPCSTMRRHLARLVEVGLILRNDSPNGKRYIRRSALGEQRFGLDLSPLLRRADEIRAAAQRARDTAAAMADLRSDISLMRRDVISLLDLVESQGGALPSDDPQRSLVNLAGRILRRKPCAQDLWTLHNELTTVLKDIRGRISTDQTDELGTWDNQNEQHYQRSDKEDLESECCKEKANGVPAAEEPAELTLDAIVSTCGDIVQFVNHDIRTWSDLVHAADQVRPMMGIELSVWSRVKGSMGAICAAATLAAILQRFTQIRSPGAYLQALAAKAQAGQFSIDQMIRALSRRDAPKFTAVNC